MTQDLGDTRQFLVTRFVDLIRLNKNRNILELVPFMKFIYINFGLEQVVKYVNSVQ